MDEDASRRPRPPVATSEELALVEQSIIADVLGRIVPVGIAATAVIIVGVLVTSADQPTRLLPPAFLFATLVLAWLDTRGLRFGRALLLSLVGIGGATLVGMVLNGGLDAPAWKLSYFTIAAAAWAFGRRGGSVVAAVVLVAALTIFGLDALDVLPHAAAPSRGLTLLTAVVTAWLVWLASMLPQRRFRAALLDALTRERELAAEQVRRARAEEERLALEGQLRHAQKMQAIGTLAGGIAHDFNNILAAIVVNLELARRDVGPDHAARESLDAIDRGTTRATTLVRQILAFSSKQASQRAIVPLLAIVEEAAALLRAALPASIELRVEDDGTSPHVRADASRLHQVIMNVGTNAWHAIEPGRGHIVVRVGTAVADATPRFPIGLRAGHYARVTVDDDGHGMDAATIDRIFEPFFTTKAFGKGTGLGLAVVHGIVAEHDGAISVDSAPGRGARFTIYLPAVDVEDALPAAVVGPPPASERLRRRDERIFLVDDEPMLRQVTARALELLGFRVTAFERPNELLAALRADPRAADAVVTDYNMPEMMGTTLARELARLRPDLPVVLVSGRIDDDDANAIPHRLAKPYKIGDLVDLLQRLLAR